MTKLILLNTCPKCKNSCVPIKGETIKNDNGTENFHVVFKCMNSSCDFTIDETFEDVDKNFKKILTNSSPIELVENVSRYNEQKRNVHYELSRENVFGSSDEYEIIEKLISAGLLKIEFNELTKDDFISVRDVIDKYNYQLTKIINVIRLLQDRMNSNDLIKKCETGYNVI